MKNYLEFEKEIKALEEEVEGLKSPFGSEGISEVDTKKIQSTESEINEAISTAPQTTRARLRGEFIKRAREQNRDYTVDWVHLKLNDHPQQRSVLCKDPFKYVDERVEKLIETL